jgi:hypothetical protein
MSFIKGDRVKTPLGNGTVLWKRMAAPDYIEVDCYSIELDTKKAETLVPPFPYYNGTVFPAEEVSAENGYEEELVDVSADHHLGDLWHGWLHWCAVL